MLVVIAIPALNALREVAIGATWARTLAAALVLLASLQFAFFLNNFTEHGPLRTGRFEADIPWLLGQAWAKGGAVYIDYDDREPQALARWYALMRGIDQSRVVRLPDGGIPPTGTIAFGRTQECDYICARLEESGDYWIARVEGPRPPS
jgi:hypothetical protein